jgi:hypothetical protein
LRDCPKTRKKAWKQSEEWLARFLPISRRDLQKSMSLPENPVLLAGFSSGWRLKTVKFLGSFT